MWLGCAACCRRRRLPLQSWWLLRADRGALCTASSCVQLRCLAGGIFRNENPALGLPSVGSRDAMPSEISVQINEWQSVRDCLCQAKGGSSCRPPVVPVTWRVDSHKRISNRRSSGTEASSPNAWNT